MRFLEGFSGTLQVDGYAGYNQLQPKVRLAGCWAHARRKFTDVLDALPKGTDKTGSLAVEALKMIAELYAMEAKLKEKWGDDFGEAAVKAILAERQQDKCRRLRPVFRVLQSQQESQHRQSASGYGIQPQ